MTMLLLLLYYYYINDALSRLQVVLPFFQVDDFFSFLSNVLFFSSTNKAIPRIRYLNYFMAAWKSFEIHGQLEFSAM